MARAMTGSIRAVHSESASGDSVHAAEQAERCRRLSKSTFDRKTSEMLDRMAEDYERQARSAKS